MKWAPEAPIPGGNTDVWKCGGDLCGALVRGEQAKDRHDAHFHPEALVLTEPQALMLEALRDLVEGTRSGRSPVSPRECARKRWPSSPAWHKRTRKYGTNDPGAMGGTMPMKAATVLWRLQSKGLADRVGATYDHLANLWVPTTAGKEWLEVHRPREAQPLDAGGCGECNKPEQFAWDSSRFENGAPLIVCRKHQNPAPDWAYNHDGIRDDLWEMEKQDG